MERRVGIPGDRHEQVEEMAQYLDKARISMALRMPASHARRRVDSQPLARAAA